MHVIREKTLHVLQEVTHQLRLERLTQDLASQLAPLAEHVYEPCEVAVVGLVSAGKSSFLNAFLGTDLALVGNAETTATINYFRYKTSASMPAIRCYWLDGRHEVVDQAFVNGLQGHDEEVLQRANDIERIEFYLPHPDLEHMTLVDTPGLGSVILEHQNRNATYMNLQRQLRARHNQETLRLSQTADAIIYLQAAAATQMQADFLQDFARLSQGQSRAFNAISVIAKIDNDPMILKGRTELAAKVAQQLGDKVNLVLPISAGLQRGLDQLSENQDEDWLTFVKDIQRIPSELFQDAFQSPELYLDTDFLDQNAYPVQLARRRTLASSMPWRALATLAQEIYSFQGRHTDLKQHLYELAGFRPLREALHHYFMKRGEILRCHNLLKTARRILAIFQEQELLALRQRDQHNRARQERFLFFLRQATSLNPVVAREFEEFVRESLDEKAVFIANLLGKVQKQLEEQLLLLEQYNSDFTLLDELRAQKARFSDVLLQELYHLFGFYGVDVEQRLMDQVAPEYVSQRLLHWRNLSYAARDPLLNRAAQQAVLRYSLILQELLA